MHENTILCKNMAFRADEKIIEGRDRAFAVLTAQISASKRVQSERRLNAIIDRYGPVVDLYPTWHPLVTAHSDRDNLHRPPTLPNEDCGYSGLDHTIYLRNGLITCPYSGEELVLGSMKNLKNCKDAWISAEKLEANFYADSAKPILIKCDWKRPMENDGTVPKHVAIPLILERELPCWRTAEVAESWESMRSYLLGMPHGSRSSLFVNQETGQAIKNIWNSLIQTGIFGTSIRI